MFGWNHKKRYSVIVCSTTHIHTVQETTSSHALCVHVCVPYNKLQQVHFQIHTHTHTSNYTRVGRRIAGIALARIPIPHLHTHTCTVEHVVQVAINSTYTHTCTYHQGAMHLQIGVWFISSLVCTTTTSGVGSR